MTFFDIALFSTMVIGFVIGIHQSIYYGVAYSYWLFMLSSLAFLWLNQRLKRFKDTPVFGAKVVDKSAKKPNVKSKKQNK